MRQPLELVSTISQELKQNCETLLNDNISPKKQNEILHEHQAELARGVT